MRRAHEPLEHRLRAEDVRVHDQHRPGAERIARYAAAAALLRAGFTRLGLQGLLPAELRSNTITALRIPAGHTYASLHDGLKARGFVIYEGQGKLRDEVFRIANMGDLGREDFERCLVALREVLRA